MDVFKMLIEDHRKVKGLFKEYEESGEKAFKKKEKLAHKIFHELTIHTQLEEEILYPRIKEDASKEEVVDLVKEAYEEHLIAKDLIEKLKKLDLQDETYDAKMKVLRENVEHHIKEEEKELFPEAKKDLKNQIPTLTEEVQERKEILLEESA